MSHYFTFTALVSTGFLTAANLILGGWDAMGKCLVALIVADYVTALVVALCEKKINSEIGFKGIGRKVLILVCVFTATWVNTLMPDVPLRVAVIAFYISNEGISILENVSKVLPVPQKMKDCFEQLRSKDE